MIIYIQINNVIIYWLLRCIVRYVCEKKVSENTNLDKALLNYFITDGFVSLCQ